MGYRLNRLDEPVFMAVSKPMQTEFGIHHRLESCDYLFFHAIFLKLVSTFLGNEERPPNHNQQAAGEDGKANQDSKGSQGSNENKGNKGKNNKSKYGHLLLFSSL